MRTSEPVCFRSPQSARSIVRCPARARSSSTITSRASRVDLGIAGRGCVITGGSRGIGLETAKLLLAEGASTLLIARSEDTLTEAAEACRESAVGDAKVAVLAIDITAESAADQIVAAANAEFGA